MLLEFFVVVITVLLAYGVWGSSFALMVGVGGFIVLVYALLTGDEEASRKILTLPLMFLIAVVLHEAGHFAVARLLGYYPVIGGAFTETYVFRVEKGELVPVDLLKLPPEELFLIAVAGVAVSVPVLLFFEKVAGMEIMTSLGVAMNLLQLLPFMYVDVYDGRRYVVPATDGAYIAVVLNLPVVVFESFEAMTLALNIIAGIFAVIAVWVEVVRERF